MNRCLLLLSSFLLGTVLGLSPLSADDDKAPLSDAEFKEAARAAAKLMRRDGNKLEKKLAIAQLSKDDRQRSVDLLFQWAVASENLCSGKLEPKAHKARASLEKYRAKVLKKHKGSMAGWSDKERARLQDKKADVRELERPIRDEIDLQGEIADGVRATTDKEAVAWMAQYGVPQLLAVNGALPVLDACIQVLLKHDPAITGTAVVTSIGKAVSPSTRIRALDWIGLELIPKASSHVIPCLSAKSVPVARAAVRALKALNDPHSVPGLIQALSSATGTLAAEIVDTLFFFTGHKLSEDAMPWERWWKAKGEKWLAAVTDARSRGERVARGDVEFYGIRSPSKRIVFVLDRSGSMNDKAPASLQAGESAADVKQGAPAASAGTLLDVAKTNLRRTINGLGTDVKFNVIFYNHKVTPWKPEGLVAASDENKGDARTWFMKEKAIGSTSLFEALSRALDYADQFDGKEAPPDTGADTFFLLSDGAPTNQKNALMTEDEIEDAIEKFLHDNALVRCVVHTIGVGPKHKKSLMRRIAEETGGTYIAVGMK